MSNSHNPLSNLMPGAGAPSAAEKEQAEKEKEKLDKWNLKLREAYIDHYSNQAPNYRYRYYHSDSFENEKGGLDLSGQNSMLATNHNIKNLKDGRWVSKPKRGFDIVVEKGSVRTSPKPNGKGPKAYRDAWSTTFDFLKKAGATSAYISIESFDGYNQKEIYTTAKIILKQAIHAQIGIVWDDKFRNAIDGMDLKQRDKLKALQREANSFSFSRQGVAFKQHYNELLGAPTYETRLNERLAKVKDEPDEKLKAFQGEMERLKDLETSIERAEDELIEYAQKIEDDFTDRKVSDEEVDLLYKSVANDNDIREKLMSLISMAREQAEKTREVLTEKLNELAPSSIINKPGDAADNSSSAAPAADASADSTVASPANDNETPVDGAGLEITAASTEDVSTISSDELTHEAMAERELSDDEKMLAPDVMSESEEKPATALDHSDPSLIEKDKKNADKVVDLPELVASADAAPTPETAAATSPVEKKDTAAPAAPEEKPKLTAEQQAEKQKLVAKVDSVRGELEKSRHGGRNVKAREDRDNVVATAFQRNQKAEIDRKYEERMKHHQLKH
ncbi:MAG: hypothetical protein ACYC0J_02435 [Gammaproteobacteria bacterium]